MQENQVILEIPGQIENEEGETEWQPPVLRHAEPSEKIRSRRCVDVFFMQYVICIFLLTILFAVRLYDESIFQNAVHLFETYSHAPTEPWLAGFLEWIHLHF
ncbi:MAG: hypothetical protein K2H29_03765 [Oscillospiraceae bacterium]|nr:hypothetical protein [Oscillospiraceae bacterium]MDE5884180.1 hypothetical protein [Oscillospiraceae bacterium]